MITKKYLQSRQKSQEVKCNIQLSVISVS